MQDRHFDLAPAQAAVYGLTAGFAATLLLSGLTRIPGLRPYAYQSSFNVQPPARVDDRDARTPMSPASALVQTAGPGPEGPAGLFAAKIASGMFGRDLAKQTSRWGRIVHFAYGSFWGLVYAMFQTRRRRRPAAAGAAHGALVWAVGPGLLVPAMKLMPPPSRASRGQAALGATAHILFGLAIAYTFDRLLCRQRTSHGPASA